MNYPEINTLIDLVMAVHRSSSPGSMDLVKLRDLLERLEPSSQRKLTLLLGFRRIPAREFMEQLRLAKAAAGTLLPNRRQGGGGTAAERPRVGRGREIGD